jgi:hypothetical protein
MLFWRAHNFRNPFLDRTTCPLTRFWTSSEIVQSWTRL